MYYTLKDTIYNCYVAYIDFHEEKKLRLALFPRTAPCDNAFSVCKKRRNELATLLNFEVDLPVKQKSALSSVMRIFKKALSRRVSRLFEGRWKKDYYYLLPKLEKEL